MRDYYKDGFDKGYGRNYPNYDNDYPKSDGDRYDYEQGIRDGQRRKDISRELDREDGYYD
jgi:hypothetical protein